MTMTDRWDTSIITITSDAGDSTHMSTLSGILDELPRY